MFCVVAGGEDVGIRSSVRQQWQPAGPIKVARTSAERAFRMGTFYYGVQAWGRVADK